MLQYWLGLIGVLLAGVTFAAGAAPSPQTTPSAQHSIDPCAVYSTEKSYHRWWDMGHRYVSRAVCWPSRWVDSFFVTSKETDTLTAGTSVRLKQSLVLRDDHETSAPISVHARVRVPNLQGYFKQRLSLLIFNDDNALSDHADGGQPLKDQVDQDQQGFRSALRWALRRSNRINLDFDIGVHSGIHPYTQLRYHWRKKYSWRNQLRFTETVEYRWPEGASNETEGEFFHKISPYTSISFGVDAYLSEETRQDGTDWRVTQTLAFYHRYGEKSALRYSLGTYAYSGPSWQTQNYRTSFVYRRRIFRPWLFIDAGPFWEWPRNQDFDTVSGFSISLEVLFGYMSGAQ